MKLTNEKLVRIVKEEVDKVLNEKPQAPFVIQDKETGWYVDANEEIGMSGWVEDIDDAATWGSKEDAKTFAKYEQGLGLPDVRIVGKPKAVGRPKAKATR